MYWKFKSYGTWSLDGLLELHKRDKADSFKLSQIDWRLWAKGIGQEFRRLKSIDQISLSTSYIADVQAETPWLNCILKKADPSIDGMTLNYTIWPSSTDQKSDSHVYCAQLLSDFAITTRASDISQLAFNVESKYQFFMEIMVSRRHLNLPKMILH